MLVVLGASGCETIRDLEAQSRVDPQTIALYRLAGTPEDKTKECPVAPTGRYANEHSRHADFNDRGPADNHTGAVPLNCFNFPTDATNAYSTAAEPQGKAYNAAVGQAKTGQEARYARNRLASILMKQSDDVCTVEMGRLVSRDAMVNTGLSIGDSGLSAAATVATGQMAKSILSGGAGLLNSSRESVNANVYRNIMSTAVAKAIENERGQLRKDILTHFDSSTVSYPVDEMVMDVNRYHQSCSFYHGLGLVLDAVSRSKLTESDSYVQISGEIANIDAELRDDRERIKGLAKKSAEYAALDKEIGTLVTRREGLIEKRTALAAQETAVKKDDSSDGGTTTTVPANPPPSGSKQKK